MAVAAASPTCSEVCCPVSLWSCGSTEAGLSPPSTTRGMADVPNHVAAVPFPTTKVGEENDTRRHKVEGVP